MERKHPNSPAPQKVKTRPTAGKLVLTVFGTHKGKQGLTGKHSRERFSTVNSAC